MDAFFLLVVVSLAFFLAGSVVSVIGIKVLELANVSNKLASYFLVVIVAWAVPCYILFQLWRGDFSLLNMIAIFPQILTVSISYIFITKRRNHVT